MGNLANLPPDVSEAVRAILKEAEGTGWHIGPIIWDNETHRIVSFKAKSPSGASFFVICSITDLVDQLTKVLTPQARGAREDENV